MLGQKPPREKPFVEWDNAQRAVEAIKRLAALKKYFEFNSAKVEVASSGLLISKGLEKYELVLGHDPRTITFEKKYVTKADLNKVMALSATASDMTFSVKASVGPDGDGHCVRFAVELLVPELKCLYPVLGFYAAALDTCQDEFCRLLEVHA